MRLASSIHLEKPFEKRITIPVTWAPSTFLIPEYAGGYEEIIRSFQDVEMVNWNRLLKYLDRMGEKILLMIRISFFC